MTRSLISSGLIFRGFMAFLSTIILIHSSPVGAQDWEVWGRADGLTLGQDEDDGLNLEGEISLTVIWTHLDEERDVLTTNVTPITVGHNWDVSGPTLANLGLLQSLMTQECEDSDYIFISANLNESDMFDGLDDILSTVAGIAVGITVATVLAPTGPGAAAAGALAAKIAGAVVGAGVAALVKSYSGIEDLGSVESKRLAYGNNVFTLSGPDGGGTINIEDRSFQTFEWNLNCAEGIQGRSPEDPVDPDTAVNGIFPAVFDVLAMVPAINREDFGGPDGDTEIHFYRQMVAETVTSMAEMAAVYFVYQAQTGYLGAPAAIPLLASGRAHHAAGDYVLAVTDYREAFRISYTAIWDGNLGPAYLPEGHLTLLSPVRMVSPESFHDIFGWPQSFSPTEQLDFVHVDGQVSGMDFFVFPGWARTGVVLAGDLSPDFEQDSLIGLRRIVLGAVVGPDANCDFDHLEEGSVGAGIFIDGQGPFFEPDPAGCGYGEVVETYMDIPKGGLPYGASLEPEGTFTLALTLTDEILPGEYPLTGQHPQGFLRQVTSRFSREMGFQLLA